MIIKSTELTGRISNHVVVLSIGVSGGTLQIRSTSSACICALMFSIGTAPSLTGWLCPHVSFVCAHLCLSTHAYVPAYVSSFLIVFTHMPLSSSGRKACRLDVMYVERWSRSLCALGDAARTSPCGRFPFWGPVGGTPRKNTDICIHCSQTYKAQQLRTGLPVIMSHTHTHTHTHTDGAAPASVSGCHTHKGECSDISVTLCESWVYPYVKHQQQQNHHTTLLWSPWAPCT